MKRTDCLKVLTSLITDELVVVGIAGQLWEYSHLSQHEGNMGVGSMGNAAAVATGMAISAPHRRVISLDGDGSTMLSLSILTTMATYQPANLKVFVFDNQRYSGSRISHPSATEYRTSIAAMAKGAGIESATTVYDIESFEQEARSALTTSGLRYIVAKIQEDVEARRIPKPNMDYFENKYRFIRYIERTEGKTILPTIR